MKNKIKTVWATRFNKRTSKNFEHFGSSIEIDRRYLVFYSSYTYVSKTENNK